MLKIVVFFLYTEFNIIANIIVTKLYHFSKYTNIILFKTFISNIYLSSICIPNRYCMAKLKIAYNNVYHIMINYRGTNGTSVMFLNDYVDNLTINYVSLIITLYKRIQL